jgi:hypothetical protein
MLIGKMERQLSGPRCEVRISGSDALSTLWSDFELSPLDILSSYQPVLKVTDCGHESLGICDIFIIYTLRESQ